MKTSDHLRQNVLLPMELPLTSSAADSRAKTSATPESVPELKVSIADCGQSMPVLLAKYDPTTSSWRTSQLCLDGDLAEFSETWPRSGMMRNGIAYRLPPLAQSMTGTDSGLLPTLTRCGNYNRKGASRTSGDGLGTVLRRMLPTLPRHDVRGGSKPERTERMWQDSRRGCDLPSTLRLLYPETTGIINPSWADGYMGYPIGWTELQPSETPSSRKSRK